MPEPTLADTLVKLARQPLDSSPAELSAKVIRRIVDNESLEPKLDVAAFNSAAE